MSLATLTLCFPAARLWQSDGLQDVANDYVKYYLGLWFSVFVDRCSSDSV